MSVKPQHILELNVEEKRRFVESFDRVYSDIDGVIWNIEHNVPNASDGFAALEHAGKAITYVTNNSIRSVDSTVKRFAKVDMQVSPEQIWHPAQTLIYYLRSINFDGLIYIIATPKIKAMLRDAGYQLIDGVSQFHPVANFF